MNIYIGRDILKTPKNNELQKNNELHTGVSIRIKRLTPQVAERFWFFDIGRICGAFSRKIFVEIMLYYDGLG